MRKNKLRINDNDFDVLRRTNGARIQINNKNETISREETKRPSTTENVSACSDYLWLFLAERRKFVRSLKNGNWR